MTADKWVLTADRDDLLAGLVPAVRFVSRHTSTPAIQNVRLRWKPDEDVQVIEATDLNMGFRTHLWGQIDQPHVEALLHPKLHRAVAAMQDGQVTVTADGGGEVEVKGKGRARYTVPLGAGDMPPVTPGMERVDWDSIPPVDAKDALSAMATAARFVARDEKNPSITGVNLRHEDQQLVVSATDGSRLAELRVALPADDFPFGEQDVTLPTRMVVELEKLFPDGELKLTADDKAFFAAAPSGGTYFQSRRIGGKFPDTSVLLQGFTEEATLPRSEIRDALRKLDSVTSGKVLEAAAEAGSMRLKMRGDEGEAEEWVDLPGQENLRFGFNLGYLLSAMELFDTDTVRMDYSTPLRPAMFSDGNGKRLVLMPVRLV